MRHTHFFLILIFFIPALCAAQNDSLVDCFPLSVGNEWIYIFEHTILNVDPAWSYFKSDTGIIRYTIVNKSDYTDSILWTFKERRNLRRRLSVELHPHLDSLIVDSSYFELVELKSGRHAIYRSALFEGNPLNSDTGIAWNSIIPFQRDQPDSEQLYRYLKVDSTSIAWFWLEYQSLYFTMQIKLKKDVGLIFLSVLPIYPNLEIEYTEHYLLQQTLTDIRHDYSTGYPQAASLIQNYPNPFNPGTRIEYDVPTTAHVSLIVYNVLGEDIIHLKDETLLPGHYSAIFDGSQLPSGVYFAKLSIGGFTAWRKMVLVR